MPRLLPTCLFVLLICLYPGIINVYGQHQLLKKFNTRSYYEENDGLISKNIFVSAQASSGEIWFGTQKGISTFDGIRWSTIEGSENLPFHYSSLLKALPGDSMLQISYTPNRTLGLRLFHHKKAVELQNLPKDFGVVNQSGLNAAVLKRGNELEIAIQADSALWLGNTADKQWQQFALPEDVSPADITKLVYYQKTLLMLTTKGLYSFHPATRHYSTMWPAQLKNREVISATTSPDAGKLYLLGNDWIGEWDDKGFRFLAQQLYQEKNSYLPTSFYNITATNSGLVIFQHNNSLMLYNTGNKNILPFRLAGSFSSSVPTSILEDRENNLWFTSMRGVAMVNNLGFATVDIVAGLPDSEVSTILPIDSSTVLLGSNIGVNVLKSGNWHSETQGKRIYSINNYRIMDARRVDQQIFIAGNKHGLGVMENDYTIKWYTLPNEFWGSCVGYWQGQVLVGTDNGKILKFENGKFQTFSDFKQSLYIRKLFTDKENRLLVLTPKGLFHFDGANLSRIEAENLHHNSLFSYAQWQGRILFGTSQGVCELIDNKVVPVSGIAVDRPVYALLPDKKGRLWMGTDKGVYILDNGQLKNYNRNNGLVGHEINRSALVEMTDGSIWIGTDRGLSVFDPVLYREPTVVPTLTLETVKSNDKLLSAETGYRVDYNQNTLEFSFKPVTFYLPEALQYRYRLEGLEKEWTYSDNYLQNSVRFTSLPPGTYSFSIQARVQNGSWSPVASSPAVIIAPPFYTRWWFITLLILGVGFVGYTIHSFIFYKSNESRLKAAIQNKKSQIRQSESKFKAIWETMDTGVVLTTREAKIVMANPSFCRMFQQPEDALVGNDIANLLEHERFSKAFIEDWYQNPRVLRFEVEAKVGRMPLYLLVTFSFLNKLTPKEPLLVIGLKDVSDQKEAEIKNLRLNELLIRQNRDLVKKELELATFNSELLERQTELQQALQILEDRNFELDQFVYKTSHDLRAPIASAIGLLNIMKMEDKPEAWPRYVDLIMRSLQKQDNFIKAMLNFSKTARAMEKAELILFEPLITQCLLDLQYLPGLEEISRHIKVNEQGAGFYSDKMKINIILSNIFSNCIKYRDTTKASSYLEVCVEADEQQARIRISDNGIGINEAYLKNIFDMFYRATERSDGSGLGLYIVKQTVERLGGKIEVSSELGTGSCFTIIIPNMEAKAETAAAQQTEVASAFNS
ncbi:ATP-binding protein [Cesiribacter sp. SM1]|uniref:sensor histidine kinase n=1 Tax=Cesiribacter sp. SM1 TaxID=2861196 RepID=UPI001CD47894|nr:ATP-binding protein [Cesiribacter sp. SM1]